MAEIAVLAATAVTAACRAGTDTILIGIDGTGTATVNEGDETSEFEPV